MDLKKALADHLLWLISKGKEGVQADLSEANLFGVNFSGVDLSGANLTEADLSGANLEKAILTGADLYGANLEKAILTGANMEKAILTEANLEKAILTEANLRGANLTGANLKEANLFWANLTRANLTNTKLPDFQIPQNVSLVGYKKVRDDYILKLEIPFEAKRTANLISNKCRAEYARVIGWRHVLDKEFYTDPQEFRSWHDYYFVYRIGETIKPDSYNPDIREECTGGVHFFINEIDAQNYHF